MKMLHFRLFVAKVLHPRTEVFLATMGAEECRQTVIAYRPHPR